MSNKTFRMLLPMTLPRSISVVPLTRELIETANSGALVPKATIVSPMRSLETLKFAAIEEAPETSQSAPLIRKAKPIMSKAICKIINMFIFLAYVYIIDTFLKKYKSKKSPVVSRGFLEKRYLEKKI